MPSDRWREAREQVDELRRHLLPATYDPLGAYPDPQLVQVSTRAFVVLAHAEIEAYLESSAKGIARAAETAWTGASRLSLPLMHLFACLGKQVRRPTAPLGVAPKDVPALFSDAVGQLFQDYYTELKGNHGVKEVNVLAMFSPLGLPHGVLSPTLLPNLDNFGKLRGDHAHQSAQAVVNVLDPQTEEERVSAVLTDLLSLDAWTEQTTAAISAPPPP